MNDTNTALDTIEAALQEAYDGNVSPGVDDSTLREALALFPALREQLTPGEDTQEALKAIDKALKRHPSKTREGAVVEYSAMIQRTFDVVILHMDTIRKALQKPQAVDVVKQDHRECGCITCVCEDEEQCQGCGARFCSAHHKQGYLTQPTEDKTS